MGAGAAAEDGAVPLIPAPAAAEEEEEEEEEAEAEGGAAPPPPPAESRVRVLNDASRFRSALVPATNTSDVTVSMSIAVLQTHIHTTHSKNRREES